ncbi:hypothetical protein C8R43DRAFT_1118320 [Mycena crocata]|nr:hypothetical protein C8R43DRAFT_1118320 [Mycena crocata]
MSLRLEPGYGPKSPEQDGGGKQRYIPLYKGVHGQRSITYASPSMISYIFFTLSNSSARPPASAGDKDNIHPPTDSPSYTSSDTSLPHSGLWPAAFHAVFYTQVWFTYRAGFEPMICSSCVDDLIAYGRPARTQTWAWSAPLACDERCIGELEQLLIVVAAWGVQALLPKKWFTHVFMHGRWWSSSRFPLKFVREQLIPTCFVCIVNPFLFRLPPSLVNRSPAFLYATETPPPPREKWWALGPGASTG